LSHRTPKWISIRAPVLQTKLNLSTTQVQDRFRGNISTSSGDFSMSFFNKGMGTKVPEALLSRPAKQLTVSFKKVAIIIFLIPVLG
jgi:hypothetical protein